MANEERDPKLSEQAPAPDSDDALTPGNILRELTEASRSERAGDSTPTGPETSPPVDPATA